MSARAAAAAAAGGGWLAPLDGQQHPRLRLLKLACLSRLAILLYAVLADALIPDHDAEVGSSMIQPPSIPRQAGVR